MTLVVAFASNSEASSGSPGIPATALRFPFVANDGQLDARVAYYTATSAATVFVTRDGRIVHSLRASPGEGAADRPRAAAKPGWTLTEKLIGREFRPLGAQPAATRVSSFIGDDPACWRESLATYALVELGQPWPGIAVSLQARGDRVEKLFRLEPGVSEAAIGVRIEGATRLRAGKGGALVAQTGLGEVILSAPAAYQEDGETRVPVSAAYRISGNRYGFRLGPHDPTRTVVIDPILQATYLGGAGQDVIAGIFAHPQSGEIYVAGFTTSTDFPGTAGGAQPSPASSDAFVARLSSDLKTLKQATYLGGSSSETASAIVLHPLNGEVIISGSTFSTDFPKTTVAAQPASGGNYDAFVARLSPDLTSLRRATYYGGSLDERFNSLLAVHGTSGDIYLTGDTKSNDLPSTTGGAQETFAGVEDIFVARFSSDLTSLLQATYFGGAADEFPQGFTLDFFHDTVLVAGRTGSAALPRTRAAAQPNSGGGWDAFVALFNSSLTQLLHATFLGGGGSDFAEEILIHPISGDLYVSGGTGSTDFPATAGGAQSVKGRFDDFFVARLDPGLDTLTQATYVGGGSGDYALAITVPGGGETDILVAGLASSFDFPGIVGGAQRQVHGNDVAVSRLNAALTRILQSTFFGGRWVDVPVALAWHPDTAELLVAGHTESQDLPHAAGGAQPGYAGGSSDGFVARLTPDLAAAPSVFPHIAVPVGFAADPFAGAASDGNGIFEPGETVTLAPYWKSIYRDDYAMTGAAGSLTGPGAATYSLTDAADSYGTIPAGGIVGCLATADCYAASVSSPPARPATHWDASLLESVTTTDTKTWSVHIGGSFADVPRSQPFYARIETLLHNGVTTGCSATAYCPTQTVTRDQMAIFLAKVMAEGAANIPVSGLVNGAAYNCAPGGTSLFTDVLPTDAFCRHVHYLARWGVTKGCSPTQFCPSALVDRGAMAAFMAKGILAPYGAPVSYTDAITGLTYSCSPSAPNLHFSDVLATDLFCSHIHYLWARGMIGGCGGSAYCQTGLVTRDTMAKFLVNAFDLKLYGP
jgi:hypothetical protein